MQVEQRSDSEKPQKIIAPASAAGSRFDAVAAKLFSDYSRSRLQDWIKRGFLTVDGVQRRTSDKLVGGEEILLLLPPDAAADTWEETWANGAARIEPEDIPVSLIHTDEHFYIINKPASLVMHPAPGNRSGTLMNALLHLEPALRQVPRAGIVHRLDKDTSGLCVVARTLKAHAQLVERLQQREVSREYLAIAWGDVPDAGTIDEPIGRHPKDRKRMAVVRGGKPARTHFQVVQRFDQCALVAVTLETGRTHQIRVHMTHLGHPLLGDPVYGSRNPPRVRVSTELAEQVQQFNRQALHAWKLGLQHPTDGRELQYRADPPADFAGLLDHLQQTQAHE
jgi:23S rRNA pseudouridine1911/1915/1917 synthase